jgi:hypothetical protein
MQAFPRSMTLDAECPDILTASIRPFKFLD